MERIQETLRLYTEQSDHPALAWTWVDQQLGAAGLFWTAVCTARGWPHPRPVWGVWHHDHLHLSVGTPAIRRAAADAQGAAVTVHLESGTDVVIVEGRVAGHTVARELLDRYDEKYDWRYDAEQYGPLIIVRPDRILAWRTAGWAGRESFQETGAWRYRWEPSDSE